MLRFFNTSTSDKSLTKDFKRLYLKTLIKNVRNEKIPFKLIVYFRYIGLVV